ncbi:MAG: hypothetical protein CND29_01450 [Marine Group II euryarchaeote MED-G36]|nr:MAG: hypothetical protein CND29_01450 [Marine Group II euryarchaeote MED-G36]
MSSHNLRELIRNYLSERPRNTIEISAWLSSQIEVNSHPSEITSILESDNEIVRIGTVRKSGMQLTDLPVSEWASESWVKHHERNQVNKTKES